MTQALALIAAITLFQPVGQQNLYYMCYFDGWVHWHSKHSSGSAYCSKGRVVVIPFGSER